MSTFWIFLLLLLLNYQSWATIVATIWNLFKAKNCRNVWKLVSTSVHGWWSLRNILYCNCWGHDCLPVSIAERSCYTDLILNLIHRFVLSLSILNEKQNLFILIIHTVAHSAPNMYTGRSFHKKRPNKYLFFKYFLNGVKNSNISKFFQHCVHVHC